MKEREIYRKYHWDMVEKAYARLKKETGDEGVHISFYEPYWLERELMAF